MKKQISFGKSTSPTARFLAAFVVPVILILAGVFSACEDPAGGIEISPGVPPVPPPRIQTINGVVVSPGKAALGKGVRQQFTAAVSGGTGKETVVWTVIGNTDGDTKIDDSGLLKIGVGERASVINVVASVSTDPTKNGTAAVIIIGNDEFPIENGITVSPGIITVGKKAKQTFKAVLSADGRATDGVTWTLSGSSAGSGAAKTTTDDGDIDDTHADAPPENIVTTLTVGGVLTVGEDEAAVYLTVRAEKDSLYGTAIVYIAENGGAPPKDDTDNPDVYPSNLGLAVSPLEAVLDKGATSLDAYTAELSKEGVTAIGDITWALSDKPANTSTISTDKRVTVALNETAEKLLVTATANVTTPEGGGEVSGGAVVRVRGNEKPPVVINNGVRIIPPDAVVVAGGSKIFKAEDGINGGAVAVTWRVLGGGAGTIVNAGGKLTVAAGEKAAYLTLRAEMKDGSGRYGTAAIKVSGEPGPEDGPISNGITVDPGRVTLAKGGGLTFKAKDDENDGAVLTTGVTWTVKPDGVKSGTSITDGVLTIAANEALTLIMVKADGAGGKFGTAVVTVSGSVDPSGGPGAAVPAVKKVTVIPDKVTVAKNGSYQFEATVEAENGASEAVTWSITTTGLAAGTKFEADGLLKVAADESSPKTFTVRATSVFDSSKYGEAEVTVPEYTVTGVKVSPSVTGARPGKTRQFTATVEGTNSPPQTVTWTVTAAAGGTIAADTSISDSGLLTVSGDEEAEILTVTAVSTGDTGKSATARVYTKSALFVATAYSTSSTAAYSFDGENWEAAALPSSANWYGVTYGDGKFVAVASGSNKAAYSADGITWHSATTLPGSSAVWYDVTYGDGKFVAVAYSSNTAAYSEDGITWNTSPNGLPSSAGWFAVTYGGSKFVAVAYSSNKAAYSEDGITWNTSPNGLPSSANWYDVTYGDGKFVAVASGINKAAYSEDGGHTWHTATLPDGKLWEGVTYGGNKFVAVDGDNSNTAAYSADGVHWTQATMPSSARWIAVTYGGGKFVAVSYYSNKAAYSADGITWYPATLPGGNVLWRGVAALNETP